MPSSVLPFLVLLFSVFLFSAVLFSLFAMLLFLVLLFQKPILKREVLKTLSVKTSETSAMWIAGKPEYFAGKHRLPGGSPSKNACAPTRRGPKLETICYFNEAIMPALRPCLQRKVPAVPFPRYYSRLTLNPGDPSNRSPPADSSLRVGVIWHQLGLITNVNDTNYSSPSFPRGAACRRNPKFVLYPDGKVRLAVCFLH